MPAASKLSVTRVSCKSIRHCLYFTRGWLLRIFILFAFKMCVCACTRVCVAEGQDNFRDRFFTGIPYEAGPGGVNSLSCEHGWKMRRRLFPQAEACIISSKLCSSCTNLPPSTTNMLRQYLYCCNMYMALLCFWKRQLFSYTPKHKSGVQVP